MTNIENLERLTNKYAEDLNNNNFKYFVNEVLCN